MIRTERAHLRVVAQTHPGLSGKNNEDRFAVSAYRRSRRDPTPVVLAVLADGIGGHRAGEVAAEIAVETISQKVAQSDGQQPLLILQDAVREASQRIHARSMTDPSQQGMGSTCACALVLWDQLFAASVGDSRIYLLRDGDIHQLTTDHTWIQEALENGAIRPEEVRGHPNAHVIRRYLGSPIPPEVDLHLHLADTETEEQAYANQGMRLQAGDILLLCTDGLTDLVNDAEISAAFTVQPLETAVDTLIELANRRGGHDNITLIAMQVPERWPAAFRRPRSLYLALSCLGVATVLAVVAVLSILGWRYLTLAYRSTPTPTASATFTALPVSITLLPSTPLRATGTPLPPTIPAAQPASAPVTGGATYTPWPTNTPPPTTSTAYP